MAEVLEYVLVSTKDLEELIAMSDHVYESLEKIKEGVDSQNREIARLRKIAGGAEKMWMRMVQFREFARIMGQPNLWEEWDELALSEYETARDREE